MARELILKLGKKITDRVDVKLGMTQLDETSPEYYGLASVVTDEMAELALAMKVRGVTTTSSSGPMPSAFRATSSASVPLASATA